MSRYSAASISVHGTRCRWQICERSSRIWDTRTWQRTSRIDRDLGLTITVLLRTKAQLAKVALGNPFAGSESEPTKLHVTFLADAPGRARVRELEAAQIGPDEFRVVGKEIYLHTPQGYGRTKFSGGYFEKQLGVAATTRNWRTVTKLVELAAA